MAHGARLGRGVSPLVKQLAEGLVGSLLGAFVALGAQEYFASEPSWGFVAAVAAACFVLGAAAGDRFLRMLADIWWRT